MEKGICKKKVIAAKDPFSTQQNTFKQDKLKGQKDCPICGATNAVGNIKCECGASLAGVQIVVQPSIVTPKKNNKKDRRINVDRNSLVDKVFVPGFQSMQTTAQSATKTNIKPINPMDKNISDDDVDIVSDEHLDNVEKSAEDLGL